MKTRLTRRELELVGHVSQGMKYKAVAAAMGITENTVKVYMGRVRQKDPIAYSRFEMAKHPMREHARNQAYQWGEWLKRWQDQLPEDARGQFIRILCNQMADCLEVKK